MTSQPTNKDPLQALCLMAAEVTFEDLPEDAVRAAKRLFLDALGVMLGGSSSDGVETIVEFVLDQGGKPECAIPLLTSQKVPGSMAAFAMGVMARSLDMGSVHDEAIHTTEHILPVVLAATGMRHHVTGKEALTAFIVGTEVLVRIGRASRLVDSGKTHLTDGGHYIFGAVAATARILGLNENQLLHAAGMASTMTQPHSNAMYYPPTLMARVHHGFIAQDAVNCCLLAQRGITGPTTDVLAGPCGYFELLIPWKTNLDLITHRLGDEWMMTETAIKPYASCRRTHAAVSGLLDQIQEHKFSVEDIEAIHVDLPPGDFAVVATPYEAKWDPQTSPECQFSLPFVIATALVDGTVDPAGFAKSALHRQPVREFMKCVTANKDDGLQPWTARVTTSLKDGSRLVIECTHAKGHPKSPLSTDELITRFETCVSYASQKLDDSVIKALTHHILHLEEVDDVFQEIIQPLIP